MVATNAVTQPRLLNHQCFKAKNTQAHSGEKPFVYTHCSYSCTTAGSLKRHMLKHSGEKPFSCKQCNFSCTRTGALKTHMLTHSGEKPFGCTQCNYSSTQTGNLKTFTLKETNSECKSHFTISLWNLCRLLFYLLSALCC